MRMVRRTMMWAAAWGLLLAMGSAGQRAQGNGTQTGTQVDQSAPAGLVVPPDPRLEKNQAQQVNDERQKKLVEETAKLVELANELKAAVDKSNKNTLSLDVVRKADAIEKLAHNVKEGMKGE